MASFSLSDSPIQIAPLRDALLHRQAGAFASFEGWVRDHNEGRGVDGLRYEAYASLAQTEGSRVLQVGCNIGGEVLSCAIAAALLDGRAVVGRRSRPALS